MSVLESPVLQPWRVHHLLTHVTRHLLLLPVAEGAVQDLAVLLEERRHHLQLESVVEDFTLHVGDVLYSYYRLVRK